VRRMGASISYLVVHLMGREIGAGNAHRVTLKLRPRCEGYRAHRG
jgi:hypothetical protein